MVGLFVMMDVTTKTTISWRGQHTFLVIGARIKIMIRVISPFTACTIGLFSTVTYPSFFFEINGNREVFYYAIQRW